MAERESERDREKKRLQTVQWSGPLPPLLLETVERVFTCLVFVCPFVCLPVGLIFDRLVTDVQAGAASPSVG